MKTSIRALLVTSAVAVLAIAGCTEAQRRDLGEQDVKEVLQKKIEKVAEKQGIELEYGLSCTSHLDAGSKMTASCKGKTTSGQGVAGAFEGTADVDNNKCTATLKIAIGGNEVVNEPEVRCFA